VGGPVIGLVVVSDRRSHLAGCLSSQDEQILEPFDLTVLVDDSGEGHHEHRYDDFDVVVAHPERRGLAAAVQSGWFAARECDWVFHLEEDFTFTRPVSLKRLEETATVCDLAQLVLKRQPCNPDELAAGGMVENTPELWTAHDHPYAHLQQTYLFSLNPCLIPRWVRDVGWPDNGGEREFTDRLHAEHPDATFGLWGRRHDDPAVRHHGDTRSNGWKL